MSRKCLLFLVVAVLLLALLAGIGWYKFLRPVPQPAFASEEEWFKHGSFGGEAKAGLPYWLWVVMPRVFPDLLPGSGGYRSLGVAWEEGSELPVGFARKTLGFPRITENCALCHTASYRLSETQPSPYYAVGAPSNTLRVQQLIGFLGAAAEDPRFNADTLLAEMKQDVKLSLLDRLSYRFLIIPLTRRALREQGRAAAWMHEPGLPVWGPGRDDSFNLPKYMVADLPPDGSTGQCDFGDLWLLGQEPDRGRLYNWGGETPAVRSVLVDSALGFGVRPGPDFEANLARLEAFLRKLAPPPWPYREGPYALRRDLASRGRQLWSAQCAECHESGGARYGTVIPLADIGTDPERSRVWSSQAAEAVNRAIAGQGFERPALVRHEGYRAGPLHGLWLSAPYLHNGSVPSLAELLEEPAMRSTEFYRGHDVIDPVGVGFVFRGVAAERDGFRVDTRLRGNGNGGHVYGTQLRPEEKEALLEYLKTL
jgi:mono/diheme cytochrome c family protein